MVKTDVELDEKDVLILKAINAGCLIVSLKKVQDLTGLNKQLIYSRIKKMLESKVIRSFVCSVDYTKIGLGLENLVFYKMDMEKMKEIGYDYALSVTKDNPHIIRMKSLIPNTDYTLFTNEVFSDANEYYEYTLRMYKDNPKLMSLIKEKTVFTVNNSDKLMNKTFHVNAVIDAYAASRGYNVELNNKKVINNSISLTK